MQRVKDMSTRCRCVDKKLERGECFEWNLTFPAEDRRIARRSAQVTDTVPVVVIPLVTGKESLLSISRTQHTIYDVTFALDMTETISLNANLQAFVRQDTPRRWVATCPMVGVASQGKSVDDAKRCLQEAVELWFESCLERGVLDQALREANFRPSHGGYERSSYENAGNTARRIRHAQRNVLGEPFEIHLSIPAYEAATLLSATA